MHLVEHRLQEHIVNGTVQRMGRPIKPEYYCDEYKDAIDIRDDALVTALKEARAIKCEELRQEALRQIRRRKREVPDKPAAMWKNAKTGTGTFAHEIRLAAQEENPLLDASVLDNAIQTFLSRICPTFVELSISQLRMVPPEKPFSTSLEIFAEPFLFAIHRERVHCADCYLTC